MTTTLLLTDQTNNLYCDIQNLCAYKILYKNLKMKKSTNKNNKIYMKMTKMTLLDRSGNYCVISALKRENGGVVRPTSSWTIVVVNC